MSSKHPGKVSALKEYKVTGNREIAPGVHCINFLRDFDFIPGQVVKIGTDLVKPPRIYSICSGNQEKEISILFHVKQDGYLTPKLSALVSGDKILVSKPYGSFTPENGPSWWIATGTGIAPFYSMFRSGNSENTKLIHGARQLNHFYFQDEFGLHMGENYIRCCSREISNAVYPGRVTDYLSQLSDLPSVIYYLCGSALMVVEVRDLLITRGIPYDQIRAEIYF